MPNIQFSCVFPAAKDLAKENALLGIGTEPITVAAALQHVVLVCDKAQPAIQRSCCFCTWLGCPRLRQVERIGSDGLRL